MDFLKGRFDEIGSVRVEISVFRCLVFCIWSLTLSVWMALRADIRL